MAGYTLCIDTGSSVRKITKIVTYPDGGFAVLAPYHSERRGFLMKLPAHYEVETRAVPISKCVPYTAEDRVNLSIHGDGFVQFSGENQRKIISGRDLETGEPKGLGIVGPPLGPVTTGPFFSVSVWGLDGFEVNNRTRETVVISQDDFYYRSYPPSEANGYDLGVFLLPLNYWSAVRNKNRQPVLAIASRNFEAQDVVLKLRVIPIEDPRFLFAIIPRRMKLGFGGESGFVLNSPTYGGFGLAAAYPNPAGTDVGSPLDYSPPADTSEAQLGT